MDLRDPRPAVPLPPDRPGHDARPTGHGNDPPEPSDASIIEASLQDGTRFAAVYERHANALYRFAARRLGPDLGEDVVADTVLAAFRGRHRYDRTRPDARPWLMGILVKEIARHHRAEQARFRALSRAGADHAGSFATVDVDRVAAMVTAQSVRGPLAAAVGALKRRDRDVLLLFAWAQLSYQEIAETLSIPVGTVRSRLNRARAALRTALPDLPAYLDDQER
jgi:RNA polymerase sigma factor (sigma-70 family)